MNKIIPSLLFIFYLFLAACQPPVTGQVIKVADGDSFTLLTQENKQIRVRLYGIDCPERGQDFSKVATDFTANRIFQKNVKIEVKDTDQYGRIVGLVILPDNTILNEELLKAGLAWHYKHFDQSIEYAEMENKARREKIGLWSMKNPIEPWKFRRNK